MSVRYFTLEEANALLETIRPLMGDLLACRAKAARLSRQIQHVTQNPYNDVGGPVASELTRDFEKISHLIDKLQSYGCVIKDLNAGLLDFLAEIKGRDVYLCWRYGEDQITAYHEIHQGFADRQSL